MSGLRTLGISYLAAASVFAMAAALSAHRIDVDALSAQLRTRVTQALEDFSRTGDGSRFGAPAQLELAPPSPGDVRAYAHATLPPMLPKMLSPVPTPDLSMPVIIAPDLPDVSPSPPPEKAVASLPPDQDTSLTPAQRIAVTARLKENLTPEMLKNFSLFLYVSKASDGPLAQRLYVFTKDAGGKLVLAHDWAASTGREKLEVSPRGQRSFTSTPQGYYELDPGRMFAQYFSHAWNGPMPYAMFFNWEHQGEQTGLAIHAATGPDIDKLGSRASAGCVHLSPAHARELYNLIRGNYRGPVPRFAYDGDGEMSNRGELLHTKSGQLKMADGYQVLIFIENFGGKNVVAALD
jgi:lipoprotein-anchoring transpeptidase ErfK/SrfK